MGKYYELSCLCLCLQNLFQMPHAVDVTGQASTFNEEEINVILRQHNEFRRQVFPSASNMRVLAWNAGLASQAQAYANKCVFRHSKQSSNFNERFGNIGENIYIENERSYDLSTEEIARPVVAWYNETVFYNYIKNSCQPDKVCGHYTQVVWDKTHKVGCGRARCSGSIRFGANQYNNSVIIVCRYGPAGNTVRLFSNVARKPYRQGAWCSDCPEEAPNCVDNLCDCRNVSQESIPKWETPTTLVSAVASPTSASVNEERKEISVEIKQRSVSVVGSSPAVLSCYSCKDAVSESTCRSDQNKRLCEDGIGESSCYKLRSNNKVRMGCIATAKCVAMKNDTTVEAKCCETNYCNHSEKLSMTLLTTIFTTLFLMQTLLA